MPSKYDYPKDTSLHARIACVTNAVYQCRRALENLSEFGLDHVPAEARKFLESQIAEALEAGKLASEAIHGEE